LKKSNILIGAMSLIFIFLYFLLYPTSIGEGWLSLILMCLSLSFLIAFSLLAALHFTSTPKNNSVIKGAWMYKPFIGKRYILIFLVIVAYVLIVIAVDYFIELSGLFKDHTP
jgi:hypothetical protein